MNKATLRLTVVAVLSGLLFTVVEFKAGFDTFPAKRTRLIRQPTVPTQGVVEIDPRSVFPTSSGSPLALVARLANHTQSLVVVDIRTDELLLCRASIEAHRTERVDCTIPVGSVKTLTIQSNSSNWSLDYLEVATHFGSSTSPAHLLVLPRSRNIDPPGLMSLAVVGLLAVAFPFVPAYYPPRRWVRVIHVAMLTLIGAAGVAVSLAPVLTQFRIVFGTDTVVRVLLLVFAFRIWFLARAVLDRIIASRRLRYIVVGSLVFVVFGSVFRERLREYDNNYSGFLLLSTELFDSNPILNNRDDVRSTLMLRTSGFDAQFMYFAVFDPFLLALRHAPGEYRHFIDYPPYRYGRIGFSLLTKTFSFDRWRWYPATMVWMIVLSLVMLGITVAILARGAGASEAWGCVVVLIPGYWVSLQSGLPEPVASALLVAGYIFFSRNSFAVAGGLFGLSLLTRETGIVFLLFVLGWRVWLGKREGLFRTAIIAFACVGCWRLYVGAMLFSDWGWSGFVPNPGDLGIPFGGFAAMWKAMLHGTYPRDLSLAAIWLPTVLTVALILAGFLAVRFPSATTYSAVVYGLVAVSLNFEKIWVHVGNGQRGTYEVFLMLLLITAEPRLSRPWRRAMGAFWILAASYVFVGAYDASFIRSCLGFGS